VLSYFKETETKIIYLLGDDPLTLMHYFKTKLPVTQAGGGLVTNSEEKTLFILRKGKWDLPKGKIDRGETIEQGAVREVKEETGVKKLKIKGLAGVTYHIFKRNDVYQLKETFWFHMNTTYSGDLKPEIKEDITKVRWKGNKKTKKALGKTYPNIKHLFEKLGFIF
jgi:8-oxo-dGTP pyrophosphatase MutT (NUDIX family)